MCANASRWSMRHDSAMATNDGATTWNKARQQIRRSRRGYFDKGTGDELVNGLSAAVKAMYISHGATYRRRLEASGRRCHAFCYITLESVHVIE
jgi:hypothetical protein